MTDNIGITGGNIAVHIMFNICTIGGNNVCASNDIMPISGGNTVCAAFDIMGIKGCITVNKVLSICINIGSKVMPNCISTGTPSVKPFASTSTNCMSIGSITGQFDNMVLNNAVSTGVNSAPAVAIKSCHIPFTPFSPFV